MTQEDINEVIWNSLTTWRKEQIIAQNEEDKLNQIGGTHEFCI